MILSLIPVSIIIPCRNEKGTIEQAILRCPVLGKYTELIFVEGHSTDGTLAEIQRVAVQYPEKHIRWFVQQGKGKGDAVRTGFNQACGDILIILDADLTTAPEELTRFFNALVSGNADVINGSRFVYPMESGAMGFPSRLANRFFSKLVSWIMGQSVSDTLCGTKVLWKKDWERIARCRDTLGLFDPFGDFDLLFGAALLGLKIVDVPVHYKRRVYGTTNIVKVKEVWFLLWMCWKAFWKIRIKR